MTIESLEKALLGAGIAEAKAEAYILAEHFLSVSKSRLLLMRGEEFSSPELEDALRRRIAREPLAYIIGRAYFMNEEYRVTPDCLIPRPETELLVLEAEAALKKAGQIGGDTVVLDLCTGSGCVAVSLLKRLPKIRACGVDISAPALGLASENARLNGVGDRFEAVEADIFRWTPPRHYSAILANPPYITAAEMEELEPELSFEPPFALTDGGDGLSFVREICRRYGDYLAPEGVVLCEIGSAEGRAAMDIARQAGWRGEVLRDLAGRDRVLRIWR